MTVTQNEMETTQTKLPPGSLGLPLIGETVQYIFDSQFVRKRYDRYGPIFKTHLLGAPSIVVVGPEAARMVLSTQFDSFSWGQGWPQTFKDLLGRSLFVQDGAEHQQNRKLLMPAFHGKALAGYLSTIEEIVVRYLAKWERLGEFRWFTEHKQLTFEIASQLLLGTNPGPENMRLSRLFADLTTALFALVRWEGHGYTTYGKGMAARRELLAYIKEAIAKRRINPGLDALSLLVTAHDEDGKGFSDEELADQALLLLFAGHETTTSMMSSLCLNLALHPTILERARLEQQELNISGPLSIEQIGQMTYLEQVLREVERLHPAVLGGFRGIVKPIDFNGYHVPAGWRLSYNIATTQLIASNYTDSSSFDPERFGATREEHKKQAFSLIGFGGGPRICVGMAFAQLEMKVIASHLLRNYQWERLGSSKIEWVHIPTLRPKDNLHVTFRRLVKTEN
jgi:cytochrome P450